MKPSELKKMLVKTIGAGIPVMVKGAPGTGKTAIIEEAAAEAGADIMVTHPVVDDPTDYKGLPAIVDGKAAFLPFNNLTQMIEAEKPTVCFMDDLGQACPSVQAAAMQLILARQINGHQISEHITFVAATNRRQDRAGVSGILEPVKSRFATIVELEADLEDWCAWALGDGVDPVVVAFVRFRPELLHDFKPSPDIVNTPCPRTVAHVGRLMSLGLTDFETIAGAAGEGFATEFVAFLRIWQSLPSPDAVLMDPAGADVPEDPATLYALCGALANKASDQTAGRLIMFADRLRDEFNVLLVRDAVRTDAAVSRCPEFIGWASRHQDVLV